MVQVHFNACPDSIASLSDPANAPEDASLFAGPAVKHPAPARINRLVRAMVEKNDCFIKEKVVSPLYHKTPTEIGVLVAGRSGHGWNLFSRTGIMKSCQRSHNQNRLLPRPSQRKGFTTQ